MAKGFFRRTVLSARQERAVQKTLSHIARERRDRFRILACIDGTDEGFETVRMAARLGGSDECDIIVLYVRPIDQGLWSGGLQVRLARQNMLDAGFELPGVRDLKHALAILKEEGIDVDSWPQETGQKDAWGDPLGDTKVEYHGPSGRLVVLKLKTAPDVANGILDQYELGPYNLILLGQPSRWRGEIGAWFSTGAVQRVAMIAPCSVLVARPPGTATGALICTDGTSRSMLGVKRAAVLAHVAHIPVTLLAVAPSEAGMGAAEEAVANARALLKARNIPVAATRTALGKPLDKILEIGADFALTVVADEGRSRLQRILHGSLALDILRHAKSSALDVR